MFQLCNISNNFVGTFPFESDINDYITQFSLENNIFCATIQFIGSVKSVTLGFYNQREQEYEIKEFNAPLEIVSGLGNISLKDEKPFFHAHVVLSTNTFQTIAGHLFKSKIFAGEFCINVMNNPKLIREHDSNTGLSLWK
ncbi:MAG: hypothetical protein ACD_79C00297G0001 [uncultured bacterium]|nr:MAG: hypothetical protein ACD_79C00297G0001 [uncultured bacterium]